MHLVRGKPALEAFDRTGGKVLADRARSRLLKENWPRTLEELEEHRGDAGARAMRTIVPVRSSS